MSPPYIWDQHFSFGGVLLCPYSPKLLLYFPRLRNWHRPRSSSNTRYLHNTRCYGMLGYIYICHWMYILVPMISPCNLELGFLSATVHTSKYTNTRCSKFVICVQLIRSLPSRWQTSNEFSLRLITSAFMKVLGGLNETIQIKNLNSAWNIGTTHKF